MSEEKSYKEERLQKQIEWHSRKARQNKLKFRVYQIVILIASAIIPIINLVSVGDLQTRIMSSIIGAIIVVITGMYLLPSNEDNVFNYWSCNSSNYWNVLSTMECNVIA